MLLHHFHLQYPLCLADQLNCVSSIKVDTSGCLQQCTGILVTSYDQKKIEDGLLIAVDQIIQYINLRDYDEVNFTPLQGSFSDPYPVDFHYLNVFNIGPKTNSDVKDKIKKLSADYWN